MIMKRFAEIFPGILSLFLVFTASSGARKEPARAIAMPLKNIVIDGKLDDWPGNLEKHWMLNHGQAYGTTDIDSADLKTSLDLSPSFMAGYSPSENLLYLAVIVRDDSLTRGNLRFSGSQAVFATDGCEIYVEGTRRRRVSSSRSPSPERTGVLQYILCPPGGTYDMTGADASTLPNPSLSGGNIENTRTRGAFSRNGDISVFEWAIETYDRYPNTPARLIPGRTIGIDVVINDYDGSGVSAWVSWSEYKPMKFANGDALGEILIADDPGKLGTVSGTVMNGKTRKPFSNLEFEMYQKSELMGTYRTDDTGRFHLRLLAGKYSIKPKPRQEADISAMASLTIKAGRETAANIAFKPAKLPLIVVKCAERYRTLAGYRDSTLVTVRTKDNDGVVDEETLPFTMAWGPSGKYRFDYQMDVNPSSGMVSIRSDGDSAVFYIESQRGFLKAPSPQAKDMYNSVMERQVWQTKGNLIDQVFFFEEDVPGILLRNAESVRVTGKDRIEGEPVDVVEIVKTYAPLVSPKVSREWSEYYGGDASLPVRLFIGTRDFLIKQVSFTPDLMTASENMPMSFRKTLSGTAEVIIRHQKSTVNPAFAADAFAFHAPEGVERKALAIEQRMSIEIKKKRLVNLAAPDFTLPDVDGKEVKLRDFQGQVTLLEFWASWNGACLETMKTVQRIHEKFRGREVEILGINTLEAEDSGTIRSFLVKNGVTHRVLLDTGNIMGEKYGFTKIPACFLLDKKGVVRLTYDTGPNSEILERVIEKLLKE